MLAYRHGNKAFFIYGFAKNERDNVSRDELRALKQLAEVYLNFHTAQLALTLLEGNLIEVPYDD